jgi:hypothetical protein
MKEARKWKEQNAEQADERTVVELAIVLFKKAICEGR